MLNHLTNFFFPPLCVHCRREGSWLCRAAEQELAAIPVLVNPVEIAGVDLVVCRGEYDLPLLGTIIQRVKYDFWTGPTEVFPFLLTPLKSYVREPGNNPVITPIPLHWRRRMGRGFNQSEYIARALHRVTGFPVQRLIQRQRSTAPQAKLHADQRVTNVAGAFRVAQVAKIPNSVILVDDVITTGSTVKECAAMLRAAGVEKITAVALAKG